MSGVGSANVSTKPSTMKKIAYRIIYSGSVQGVGFRFTVLRFAHDFDSITGYVKNLPDGSVELLAEGPENEVESLLEDIVSGPHSGHIKKVSANIIPVSSHFSDFSVSY